ncbi:MAG: amidohydrolase family protein [Candidatus Omnitrophota bacterium]
MNKIFDSHCHWVPPKVAENTTFFKVQWSDADELLKAMDNSGIAQAVLLYPTSDAHLQMKGWARVCEIYNSEIAGLVKRYPDRFIGAGIIPVDKPKLIPREMERIRQLGLKAISLASSYDGKYLDDEIFLPVFDYCERPGLPVFIHSQIISPIGFERVNDPLLTPVVEYVFDLTMCLGKLMMSGMLAGNKKVKLVFGHFAGVAPFVRDRFDSTYLMLRARSIVSDLGALPSVLLKNIYVDTSGVKSISMLNMALETFSPDKILWGSDWPAKRDLSKSIAVIEKLNLPAEEKQGILGKNFERVMAFC